jgi:flagellar basal-body rod protein FlgC
MAIGKIFGVFGISGSGLSAQRKNLEVRAENIANAESIDSKTGEPYKPKDLEFIAKEEDSFKGSLQRSQTRLVRSYAQHINGIQHKLNANESETGVRAEAYELENSETKLIYAPEHPHANEEGYVEVADINSIEEMVKLMSAARAYGANATVINAAKDMFKKALEI